MKEKSNIKGFSLVLSLVLLFAMSLMGGSLIVIASSDHQGNNSSDEYQQTFYVAETALMEAEKSLINQMMGPVVNGVRSSDRKIPINIAYLDADNNEIVANRPTRTACYLSFRNLSRDNSFRLVEHQRNQKFINLIRPLITTGSKEETRMEKYMFEFFSVNAGSAIYKGAGASLKKTAITTQKLGTTYRIYGCGMKVKDSSDTDPSIEILIPLETVIILSH